MHAVVWLARAWFKNDIQHFIPLNTPYIVYYLGWLNEKHWCH